MYKKKKKIAFGCQWKL